MCWYAPNLGPALGSTEKRASQYCDWARIRGWTMGGQRRSLQNQGLGTQAGLPRRRCPSIVAKDGHQHPPLVIKGMVCGVGLCGVQARLRLREGTLLSLLLLVSPPYSARPGPWKIPVQGRPSLVL